MEATALLTKPLGLAVQVHLHDEPSRRQCSHGTAAAWPFATLDMARKVYRRDNRVRAVT